MVGYDFGNVRCGCVLFGVFVCKLVECDMVVNVG